MITVIAAGITLHETLHAYEELKKEGSLIRVIDLYCIKPIDTTTLYEAARTTKAIITVEDHFTEGGIGEAVKSSLADIDIRVYLPGSAKNAEEWKPSRTSKL